MTVQRLTCEFQTTGQGAANPAYTHFTFNPPSGTTIEQCAAAVIQFFGWTAGLFEAGMSMIGIDVMEAGALGAYPLPFPVDEVADWAALAVGSQVPTTYASLEFSGTGSTPVGTSANLAQQTVTLGRTGRGRSYLPFIAANAIDGNGEISSVNRAGVATQAANWLLAGLLPVDLFLSVTPGNLSAPKLVTDIECKPIPSNLKTRTR